MSKYATGKYAKAISDRSGMEFPYREMVKEWNGAFVHVSEYEPKQPQLEPKPQSADGVALLNVRTDRTEPATTVRIPDNGFETYEAGSRIINVFSPGHGLVSGTTYRFRGPPTISAGGNVFQYSNPQNFDGITGANIAKSTGYAITTGIYKNDAAITTDYSTSNYFHFTVDTDTATSGSVKGGGYGCSVGPVTIEA
tara:strand:- start:547 stop:1134 length:588 start_codon:yes stop_codon:yes gene_type:complete